MQTAPMCHNFDEYWLNAALMLDQFSFLLVSSLFAVAAFHEFILQLFCENDLELYDAESDSRCMVRRGHLLLDAVFMDMLITDKTGTLTTGEKVVAKICLRTGGSWGMYTPAELRNYMKDVLERGEPLEAQTLTAMLAMALCNSCNVDREQGQQSTQGRSYRYEFTSGDDIAIVQCAANIGFALSSSTASSKEVRIFGSEM